MQGSLEQDFATLRKLRDDDASGALTEYFGESEDPREWTYECCEDQQECVTMADGRVTGLSLCNCSSLAALPAAIGELKALKRLGLYGCSSLVALPDAIGELGTLTKLDLPGCTILAALPNAIGELKALTELNLSGCESLDELPAAIGELKALTRLDLDGCSSLERLPEGIVGREVLTLVLPLQLLSGPLREDFAALRKLREDDASGAIKKRFGNSEDPREWTFEDEERGRMNCVTVDYDDDDGGRVTILNLLGCDLAELPAAIGELKALTALDLRLCSSLAALPDAIGELKALTTLLLTDCSSLVALPESIAGLDALKYLVLHGCTRMVFPPPHMHDFSEGKSVERVKRLLANTTRFLAGEISAADADDDVKSTFIEGIITNASFADRLEEAVRKDPALADLTNDKGRRAIDVACLECREAMQKALFFLGRYEIDDGPPEHRSATSLVVRAVDHEAADDYGKLFDEFDKNKDDNLDLSELKDLAAKLGTNIEVFKLANGESYTKDAFVAKCQRLFGKERKVVIKIFQVAEQWENEKNARDDQQLDARFVVQTIPAPRRATRRMRQTCAARGCGSW